MNKVKLLPCVLAGVALVGFSQSVLSHTSLNIAKATEGTRVINNMVIGHSCGETSKTIGTSVVFPDGVDSTILVDGESHEGTVLDFLVNYGNNTQLILDRASFDVMDEKIVGGNVVGYWAGGGPGMSNHLNAVTTVRQTAASIEPTSCATEVKIKMAVADICEITSVDGFGPGTVNFWTDNTLASLYVTAGDTSDTSPAFTIERDLETNPLPESCGETGSIVEIKASAAQVDRDMPIMLNGTQVWPQP
jgi:hypothetical protein